MEQRTPQPQPSTVYRVDDRPVYVTDAHRRIEHASSQLEHRYKTTADAHRNGHQQTVAGRDGRLEFDEGGHLVAASLGGPGEGINLVAMSKELNGPGRANWNAMENDLRQTLKNNPDARVEMHVELSYPDGSTRPNIFQVEYSSDGMATTRKVFEQ